MIGANHPIAPPDRAPPSVCRFPTAYACMLLVHNEGAMNTYAEQIPLRLLNCLVTLVWLTWLCLSILGGEPKLIRLLWLQHMTDLILKLSHNSEVVLGPPSTPRRIIQYSNSFSGTFRRTLEQLTKSQQIPPHPALYPKPSKDHAPNYT
jgi:hypothetical protein